MAIKLDSKQGLIAGDGHQPVEVARCAKENGCEVVCSALTDDNVHQFKKY